MIELRGHHIFCLLGYRGMGYSVEYVENMTKVHTILREQTETMIQIIPGPDDLCAKFPDDQPYHYLDKGGTRRRHPQASWPNIQRRSPLVRSGTPDSRECCA